MSDLTIRAAQPDNETLLQKKEIQIHGKTAESPAKALEVKKTRGNDQVNSGSRGVNELYAMATRPKLEKLRSGTNDKLREQIARQYRKTKEGELNFVFLSFEETGQLDPANVATMFDLMEEYGDFIIAPLMPEIASGIESDDVGDEYFKTYKENVRIFLQVADERDSDFPVMGVLPPLSREQVEALIDLYIRAEVDAYCYNLDRRTITAASQQDELVRPLMRKLGSIDSRDTTLTYSINGLPYGMDATAGSTAEYLVAYSMGVDIVGGNHIGLRADEETIKEFIAAQEDEPDTLRLLDPQTYAMTDVPAHKLRSFLPDETNLDIDRIETRIEADSSEQYRYQKLINTEIIELVLEELIASLGREGALEHLQEKTGIPQPVVERLVETREAFEDGDSQSGLSEFGD